MTEPLTREQVEKIVAHYERLLEKLCIYSDGVDASDLLKCDAALRAENERLKGEIDTLDSLLKDRTAKIEVTQAENHRLNQSNYDTRREEFLSFRGIETVCEECGGSGERAYGSTATWHHGIGGQMITTAVCDKCWGSGDITRKWTDLRKVEAHIAYLTTQIEAMTKERDDAQEAIGHYMKEIATITARCAQVEAHLKGRRLTIEASIAAEQLAGNSAKLAAEQTALAEIREMEALLLTPAAETGIDVKRFEQAPCYMCGYNGELYYQPSTHMCAKQYHAAKKVST